MLSIPKEDVSFYLGFPKPLNFGLNLISAHKVFIDLEMRQSSTKLTFPVKGLQLIGDLLSFQITIYPKKPTEIFQST
jgi:hypothetical protein